MLVSASVCVEARREGIAGPAASPLDGIYTLMSDFMNCSRVQVYKQGDHTGSPNSTCLALLLRLLDKQ